MFKTGVFFSSCAICSSRDVSIVNTYKHYWRVCNSCGNAFSQNKAFYPLSFLPFAQLQKNRVVQEDISNTYVFAEYSDEKRRQDEAQAEQLSSEWIKLHGIDFSGKKIIEISGGTGYFINAFRKYGATVFHTEINFKDVEHARDKLQLDSRQFDFTKNRLSDVFSEKFDVILFKGALEFCVNIKDMLAGLEANVLRGTKIIVMTCVPTLGNFLITQFDEYNQQVLYQKETLVDYFDESGYFLVSAQDVGDTRNVYPLAYYRNKWSRPLMFRYMIPAMYRLSPDTRFLFHSLSVRGLHLIFQKEK